MHVALGSRLRLLVDHLDGAVDESYRSAGLDFRARYYPYFRLLESSAGMCVGEVAAQLGHSQPAVTQTLALMKRAGLVEMVPSPDRRQRRYRLTPKARQMEPALRRLWQAIAAAAKRLDRTLPAPLQQTIATALHSLGEMPFGQLINEEMNRA